MAPSSILWLLEVSHCETWATVGVNICLRKSNHGPRALVSIPEHSTVLKVTPSAFREGIVTEMLTSMDATAAQGSLFL